MSARQIKMNRRKPNDYWLIVKQKAAALRGDGCTSSPDLNYANCCHEHDIHYRTGKTVDGKPITRLQSDNMLFQCMRKHGITPIVGTLIVPSVYWFFVRVAGWNAWKGEKNVIR